jgi:hypothetical protein
VNLPVALAPREDPFWSCIDWWNWTATINSLNQRHTLNHSLFHTIISRFSIQPELNWISFLQGQMMTEHFYCITLSMTDARNGNQDNIQLIDAQKDENVRERPTTQPWSFELLQNLLENKNSSRTANYWRWNLMNERIPRYRIKLFVKLKSDEMWSENRSDTGSYVVGESSCDEVKEWSQKITITPYWWILNRKVKC